MSEQKNLKIISPLISNRKKFLRVVILLSLFCRGYYIVVTTIRSYTNNLGTLLSGAGTIIVGAIIAVFSLGILSIDLQKIERGIIDLVNVIILLLIVAVIYFTQEFSLIIFVELIAVILYHGAIFVFTSSKNHYLQTRTDTSIRGIAQMGVITFGLFISVIITLFLGVKIIDTPLECEALYTNLQEASYSSVEPVKELSINILDRSKQSVKDFAESVGSKGTTESGLYSTLKTTVIDQVLEDKELVRDSFCEMIATILEERVNKNIRSLSVYLILFLILSPIMTLVFRVVSVMIRITLKILRLTGVYAWKKRMRWIKELV